MSKRLLSVSEMSKISGMSKSYFYSKKCSRELEFPVIKIGQRVFCDEEDFNIWIESKKSTSLYRQAREVGS